ncbi:MAG: anhydro-N-acetylmuramic acid kinase [Flavobacteriales bacterium]|nr:anhydro-N-acetylmuramic acid kinase [Flavobacteriales bacterium]
MKAASTNKTYRVLGLMSGTSLDGLDLCLAHFHWNGDWSFVIERSRTVAYDKTIEKKLRTAHLQTDEWIADLDIELGKIFSRSVEAFCQEDEIDLIASHGHTIRHLPDEGITWQIGNPAFMRDTMKTPVVYDFRSADVALGGQGAPLVPIGDQDLFVDFDFCVNLGGFSNCSYQEGVNRIAGDICPVNVVLNALAERLGHSYDDQGRIAATGQVDAALLQALDSLPYYFEPFPKSLGREWVDRHVWPLLNASELEETSLLATFTHHIARQLTRTLTSGRILATGGGVKNSYLMRLVRDQSAAEWVVPNTELVDFKEALIFGFLGLLRLRQEVNVLASVTGASKDHSSGKILYPNAGG